MENDKWFEELKKWVNGPMMRYSEDIAEKFNRLIKMVDDLKKQHKELQLSYHSCLHPTPYHEREFSKNDEGDWQYETITYLPLRKVLQNDNDRLTEQNKKLKDEILKLKEQLDINTPHEALVQLQEENKRLKWWCKNFNINGEKEIPKGE